MICHNAICIVCEKGLTGRQQKFCSRKCAWNYWYKKNRLSKIKHSLDYQKNTNYACEKTPEARKVRHIKRRTRMLYPLTFLNVSCEFCDNPATEHHHNTNPITIKSFNFVCHGCHKVKNQEMRIIFTYSIIIRRYGKNANE